MALSWKDLITTILAGMTAWVYFANVAHTGSYRVPILLLAFMGIAMCAFSGGTTPASGVFMAIASTLGVVALAIIVYGLFTGAKIAFVLLTITILALWVTATFRHLIAG